MGLDRAVVRRSERPLVCALERSVEIVRVTQAAVGVGSQPVPPRERCVTWDTSRRVELWAPLSASLK